MKSYEGMSRAELIAEIDKSRSNAKDWKLAALACEDIVRTDEHFEMANDVALSLIEKARMSEACARGESQTRVTKESLMRVDHLPSWVQGVKPIFDGDSVTELHILINLRLVDTRSRDLLFVESLLTGALPSDSPMPRFRYLYKPSSKGPKARSKTPSYVGNVQAWAAEDRSFGDGVGEGYGFSFVDDTGAGTGEYGYCYHQGHGTGVGYGIRGGYGLGRDSGAGAGHDESLDGSGCGEED